MAVSPFKRNGPQFADRFVYSVFAAPLGYRLTHEPNVHILRGPKLPLVAPGELETLIFLVPGAQYIPQMLRGLAQPGSHPIAVTFPAAPIHHQIAPADSQYLA